MAEQKATKARTWRGESSGSNQFAGLHAKNFHLFAIKIPTMWGCVCCHANLFRFTDPLLS